MGKDRYISDRLDRAIKAIQEKFDYNTYVEASKKYDELARSATVGEIIEEVEQSNPEPSDPELDRPAFESNVPEPDPPY